MSICANVVLTYLQGKGRTIEEGVAALNEAAAAAGLQSTWALDAENCAYIYRGADSDRAHEFHRQIQKLGRCGKFESEVANIDCLIKRYAAESRPKRFSWLPGWMKK